jgi:hypothetical protein
MMGNYKMKYVEIIVGSLLFCVACGPSANLDTATIVSPARSPIEEPRPRLVLSKSAAFQRHKKILKDYLSPVKLEKCTFKRFGEKNDGGYLMCEEHLNQAIGAYSYGISGYDGWGCQIAQELGIVNHQYDPFDTKKPICSAQTEFHAEGIADHQFQDSEDRKFDSLESHITSNGHLGKALILKMDVEGAEWKSLLATNDIVLGQFSQIVIEIHDVYDENNFNLIEPFLKKMANLFHVAHVHSNNCCCVIGGPFPSGVLEVTYVNKRQFRSLPGKSQVPRALNSRNIEQYEDCTEPPRVIPTAYYNDFTLNGQIPVSQSYRDDSYPAEHPLNYDSAAVEKLKKHAKARKQSYYGATDIYLYQALDKYFPSLKGKKVGILGSAEPWYEAVVLAYEGSPVTIEYNKITSNHPELRLMTVEEYEANPEKFDVLFSISSFEHDGLGRYGDLVNPIADLEAMNTAKSMLNDRGVLFLSVPVGKDLLVWNLHRIYGPKRLPLLLKGWKELGRFGFQKSDFDKTDEMHQPVFVLQMEP